MYIDYVSIQALKWMSPYVNVHITRDVFFFELYVSAWIQLLLESEYLGVISSFMFTVEYNSKLIGR